MRHRIFFFRFSRPARQEQQVRSSLSYYQVRMGDTQDRRACMIGRDTAARVRGAMLPQVRGDATIAMGRIERTNV